ncbi:MAG TPA: acetolactate synthase large subunit [Geoalkalibacter subterraneus]|uniref:Acetolactate synthase large subunit n=1 Tax=Geoalkalibacter subterraneus TaxID=483547 RepID=A0A831LH51_9BACT|nr:acetolactate synthase large subunit [Geoalkalibacter subterraneus]
MNAAQLFVKALENEGVDVIYAVPGEENLDLLEALRTSSIRLILTRHEQGAAFMAATHGRLTGNPGVCLATLGPGATNLVTGAAYAQLGGFPMLMITGQKPIKKSKQGRFQIIDVVDMMQPLTKFTKQIVNVDRIPGNVREAFRRAREERPGAVHLELPEDVAAEPADLSRTPLFAISHAHLPQTDDKLVDEAAAMIRAASYPLLLIGAGAQRHQACHALGRFIDETGFYFLTTQMGKGVVDESGPLFLGTAALSENDYIHCAIDRADLIINVGHDVVEKPPFFMEHTGKKVIHVNYSSAEVDNVYFPQLEMVGDIADSIKRLGLVLGRLNQDFSYFHRIKEHLDEHLREKIADASFPLKPQRIVAEVRRVLPSDGILALDNGMYKIWFARNYLTHKPHTVLLDNALATMGAGLPSAMEAARLFPERRVMAVCGDGGFMMNSQDMETAVRLNLNLVVLVIRDEAYGMIRWKQETMGLTDFGLQFGPVDFVLHARSYGASGHRVERARDFAPLLEHCFSQGGVHLVDVPVDYSENMKVLVEELKEKVCLI